MSGSDVISLSPKHWSHSVSIFLSFRVFGILSSSLLLYSQRFGRCVFRPSADVSCRSQKPTRSFWPRPLFYPLGSLALILLTITGDKCKAFMYCYSLSVGIEPATSRWLSLHIYSYLPTPPLGQNMTQGQFLSGV